MTKYAIKIMLATDDWIYVTKDKGYCDWDMEPMLFETYEEADNFANTWRKVGKEQFVKVVEYDELENNKFSLNGTTWDFSDESLIPPVNGDS